MSPEARKRSGSANLDHVQEVMRQFVRDYPDAVLIGGWSSYLRTGAAKSHDIDVIVDHATLDKLKVAHELSSSRHIGGRKFEFKIDGIAVDVYPVYQSKLGQKLQVPVEALITRTERIGGIRVLSAEGQFVAKMAALLDRPDTLPGEKDRSELVALLKTGDGPDPKAVAGLLREVGWPFERQTELWQSTFGFLLETSGVSPRDRTMLNLKRAQFLTATRTNERDSFELDR